MIGGGLQGPPPINLSHRGNRMNTISRFAVCIITVMMIAVIPVRLAWSADENASVAQVYLEFDPATGEFKSVPATPDNSPDSGMTSRHQQSNAQKDAMASVGQDNAAQQPPAPAAPVAGTASTPAGQGNSVPIIIGAVVALVVIGGIMAMTRKKAA